MSQDSVAIRFENVNKIYKLYNKPTDRLSEALNPFSKKKHQEYFALNDVSLKVYRGETLGIIGRNGSGKSTLLKIMTGVLNPSSGSVEVNGKVSALLELGTGFNPEYTGIENIYLNASILGLTKEETDDKLEEIINFADIGDFLYQPVKVYSSGMFVRLAFAVQACIEPEILIVDEALAVGDAKFSNKCINHMKKIVEKGSTVIFVTHDVHLIKSFCERVIWLNKGKVVAEGEPRGITAKYTQFLFDEKNAENILLSASINEELTENEETVDNEHKYYIEDNIEILNKEYTSWGSGELKIVNYGLLNQDGKNVTYINWGENIEVRVVVEALENVDSENIGFGFSFRNKHGVDVIVSTTIEEGQKYGPIKKGDTLKVSFKLTNILAQGEYLLTLQCEDRSEKIPSYYEFVEDALTVQVFSDKHIYSLVKPHVEQIIKLER